MTTTVVNIHHNQCDVFIGRPSIFGNPYRIGVDGSRAQVVAQHMVYARDRIRRDSMFRDKVRSLYGKRLGCYCKQPNREVACHGDNYVILAAELNGHA